MADAKPIKAIIRTYISERDRNGNCYQFSLIYAVQMGIYKFVAVEDFSTSILKDMGVKSDEYLIIESCLNKRHWQSRRRNLEAHYPHTPEYRAAMADLFGVKS